MVSGSHNLSSGHAQSAAPQRLFAAQREDCCVSDSSYLAGQEAWEGFFVSPDPQQAVSLSAHELNFGSCSRLSPGGHKTLTVTNTNNAKVTAFLVVPGWQGLSSQSQMQQVFQVGWSCALSWNEAALPSCFCWQGLIKCRQKREVNIRRDEDALLSF